MIRPWWKLLLDRGRGVLWPIHYRIDGSSWWAWRGRIFRYRPAVKP